MSPSSPETGRHDTHSSATRRDQRGAVLPSPVVVLSIIAVAFAAVAFFVTRGGEPQEREIAPAAQEQGSDASSSADGSDDAESDETTDADDASTSAETEEATEEPEKKEKPVKRGEVYVVVFNNTSTAGLAAEVSAQTSEVGWNVVGADNWYGTIPATTVYYPPRLKKAAELLALDLGIDRTAPAVDPMQLDRLTVILTGPLA